MRVAFLTFNNGELAVTLSSAIAEKADVRLLLPGELAEPHLHRLSPKVDYQPYDKPRLRHPWEQIGFVRSLVKQIHEYKPDVVHMQIGHLWFNFALPFLAKYPLVVTVHDPVDHVGDRSSRKTPHFIKYYGYRKANRLIVHSQEMKPVLARAIDVAEDTIDVVPLMEFGDSSAQKDIKTKRNHILFFGRIWKYKGLDYLIRAEPQISKEIPDVKIVIAGTGEDFGRYEKLMQNRENFIVHNEYVSREKQARLFREASVVVLPYIEATQSGVIPAAYNFAKPVVATTVGGIPEQVDDGITGYLVPPSNEDVLAEKIVDLLKNDQLRKEMGQNGKQKVETEWSGDAVSHKTIDVYQKAIAAKKNMGMVNSTSPVGTNKVKGAH